jgi:type IV pilus assembly protein PilO
MGELLEQLDKVPASQKILLLVLFCAGLFVAFYLLAYSPLVEEIESKAGQTQELNRTRAELMANSDDVNRIRADIAELCQRQSTFMERLPPRAEIPSLLQAIHQQAQFVGLAIERFQRDDDVPGVSYTRIPVQMDVTGTYDQVSDFFYFIGRQQRIVNVSNISLAVNVVANPWRVTERTQGEADPAFMRNRALLGPPQLRVRCEISTYYAQSGNTVGGAACAEQN